MNKNINYICYICDKKYSCRQSLYAHKKRFHLEDTIKDTIKSPFSHHLVTIKSPSLVSHCEYCNKEFAFKQGKYRHQKTCKRKIDKEKIMFKEENNKLKKENEKLKKQIKIDNNQQMDKEIKIMRNVPK